MITKKLAWERKNKKRNRIKIKNKKQQGRKLGIGDRKEERGEEESGGEEAGSERIR